MQPLLSVTICAHNPRRDYLDQVLKALASQTLPLQNWELLLIDNASEAALALEIDLSWHPQSRHIREDKLGLTSARLRGISEATAEILVFVDDDNVLDADYLEIALRIGKEWPALGAWGGQVLPKFEETPPEWTRPYWYLLAIKEVDRDQWSNVFEAGTDPHGAGMCVRKNVAEKYADLVLNDSERTRLGRKGQALLCCEDTDMAFVACDIGLGMGLFVSLKLTHLIPAKRLEERYLLRLAESSSYSYVIQRSFRSGTKSLKNPSKIREVFYKFYHLTNLSTFERKILTAQREGMNSAIRELLSI